MVGSSFKLLWFAGLLAWAAEAAVPKVALEVVHDGLENPVDIATAPGEPNRLYVVEQPGSIILFDKGVRTSKPFLDIRKKVRWGGELGLLGLAFHPAYAKTGRYFINYNTERGGKLLTVVAERSVATGRMTSTEAEKTLLEFEQPFVNHNGGQLAFGPDGFLYIAVGDGGSAGDPQGNGQSKSTWLGKILRIDVDKGEPYAVPADNPFARGGGRKEIYAWGLRNPWRMSFDPKTGLLYVGDVGQNRWEEIHIVERGGNYGWNIMEASHCYSPEKGCKTAGLALPIHEYGRRDGISITGGHVYRGKAISELEGHYLYADFGSGRLWALRYDEAAKKVLSNRLLLASNLPISSFGRDAGGEILVTVYHGSIRRLVRAK